MYHPDIRFWRSVATMIGGIVGVGVFGLPAVIAQSGYAAGLTLLIILGLVMLGVQLMFGEIVLHTPGTHRLGGYVAEYLGESWGSLASLCMGLTIIGASLAYVIVGGDFLQALLTPVIALPDWGWPLVMAALVAWAASAGLRMAASVENAVVVILLFLFAFITLAALPAIKIPHLQVIHWSHVLAPYGVALFALSGAGIIPEMRDLLGKKEERKLPVAIVAAMSIVVLLYAAFSFSVVGATGHGTTPVAFDGLVPVIGESFKIVAALLGALVVFSIFLLNSVQLQNLLRIDRGVPQRTAWLIASGLPPLLYVLGARDFLVVVGFVGAVLGGATAFFIIATYEVMRRSRVCREHRCLDLPFSAVAMIGIMLAAGIILEILSLVS